jgi:hypothetical protein
MGDSVFCSICDVFVSSGECHHYDPINRVIGP